MRVLVTGGAGFIGSHVVDALLAAGHEPFVVDNLVTGSPANLPEGVPLFEVDIRDGDGLARVFDEVRPEWISHHAAQMSVSRSVREPVFDAEVNIVGMLQLLQNAVRCGGRRIVFASSGGALYGDVYEPAGEEHPCEPFSPYGISKWVGEQYLSFFAREHGIEAVALRYSNIYGPRQNPHGEAGVVAIFSERMLAAQTTTINGDGLYIRDYAYVGDVAAANAKAFQVELGDKFVPLNIGTGVGTDVNVLAEKIEQLAGEIREQAGQTSAVPTPKHGSARAGDLRSSLVSPAKACKLLDWQPVVSLDDGLRKTVNWFAQPAGAAER